jgi:hypothetical protein
LAATFNTAEPNRASLSKRTVAVVHELKVVSPPASPVASAVCHSAASPSRTVMAWVAPIMKHPPAFTSSVAQGQCSLALAPEPPEEPTTGRAVRMDA